MESAIAICAGAFFGLLFAGLWVATLPPTKRRLPWE